MALKLEVKMCVVLVIEREIRHKTNHTICKKTQFERMNSSICAWMENAKLLTNPFYKLVIELLQISYKKGIHSDSTKKVLSVYKNFKQRSSIG